MSHNVLYLIRTGMDGFSKGQKRIANYILSNYDKAAFMTACRLGQIAQVSESTVVRFLPLNWGMTAIRPCRRRCRS